MKIFPLLKVRDMGAAFRHYAEVLDFVITCAENNADSPVVNLGHQEMAFQITTHENERLYGSVIYVWLDEVDARFAKFKARGLEIWQDQIRRCTGTLFIKPGAGGNFIYRSGREYPSICQAIKV